MNCSDESALNADCGKECGGVPTHKVSVPANLRTANEVFEKVFSKPAKQSSAESLSSPDIVGMSTSDFPNIRATAASSPFIGQVELRALSVDVESFVREEVARNMLTDVDTLHLLSGDSCWRVRYNVANNFVARKDSLQHLAEDSTVQVREQVADNFNTSNATLEFMVQNETDDDVLSVLAKRKFSAPEVYETLHSKGSHETRMSLAMNSSTPSGVLVKLQEDGYMLGNSNIARLANQIVH